MNGHPLNTIIIGFGNIADTLADDPKMSEHFTYGSHAQVLATHPSFSWTAVVDPSTDSLERAKHKWGIPILAKNVSEVSSDFQADVAVITSPPDSRADIIDRFPDLKALLIEKPLGTSQVDASDLLDKCRERDILVQVNTWRRADKLYREFANGYLAELIGTPLSAFALYGNGLFNNGSHLVDMIRMLLGEVKMVQATGQSTSDAAGPISHDIMVPFALTLENNIHIFVQPVNFNNYREVGLDIWGTTGRLSLMQEGLTITHYPKGEHSTLSNTSEIRTDRPRYLQHTFTDALYRLYDNLAATIEGDSNLWSSGESALKTLRVLNSVNESAHNGGRLTAL